MTLCINPKCQRPENSENTVFCQTCGSELLLEGIYRAQSELGCGGFGKTFVVTAKDSASPKVLKVLINPMDKALELFKREAEVLEKLRHPGIPRVEAGGYFVYFARNAEDPLHCLIMEKIEGLNLQEYIDQRGQRPVNQKLVLRWLIEIVKILEMVHSQNFFHRDIKPSNIMLRTDGGLALIDFGTAREVTGTYMAKQAMRGVTGIISAGYTPVEQLNGQAIQQSDFYALGRTMSYLLTAKEPSEIYDAVTDEFPWRQFAPQIDPDFGNFLDQMMARIPKERPANTQIILQSLNQLSQRIHTQDPVVNSSDVRPISPPDSSSPPRSQANSPLNSSAHNRPGKWEEIPQHQAKIVSPQIPKPERMSRSIKEAQVAGFTRRTIAAVFDFILLGLTTFILSIGVGFITQDNFEGAAEASGIALVYLSVFVHPVMTWLYFTIMHSSGRQATLGKQLLQLKVVTTGGKQLSFGQATVRFICKLLSASILIGYPLALFSQQRQSLHDMMAETLVVVRS